MNWMSLMLWLVVAVELREAGDGTLEIMITDPSGQLIPNHVVTQLPGQLQVHYQPQVRGLHQVLVTMNGQRIQGDQPEII